MQTDDNQGVCYCDSGKAYAQCCGPLLAGTRAAQSAEALMRSRFCAFVQLDRDYLMRSWHPTTRPAQLQLDERQRWLGLKIVRAERGQSDDSTAVVEFVARYKIGGRGFRLHEVSRFERYAGRWVYVDGDVL